jgi:hypothetical protein
MPHIYILSPDNNKASGGIKILYRHADVLNANGFSASVLHQNPGFRCTWFKNTTRVDYLSKIKVAKDDFLVIPEIFGPPMKDISTLPQISTEAKFVIFNQNCRYTFLGQDFNSVLAKGLNMPYSDQGRYVATMVVSQDSTDYIHSVFPQQEVYRIHNAINVDIFTYQKAKNPQICFMPRKHAEDALQVLGILNIRGALNNVNVVAIDNMNEAQVAETMKRSMFFLSFGYPEGCPLPPAEAMACGCLVIGYDGFGGREYFKPEFSWPVPVGDITGFADYVEQQLILARSNPEVIHQKSRTASDYVRRIYSSKQEKQDILTCWNTLICKN